MRNSEFLELFFRNLLLGEKNELKNRYMIVNAPDALKKSLDEEHYPTSTLQVPYKFATTSQQVRELIKFIGNNSMSVKEMMTLMELKDRANFLNNYLKPAIQDGFLKLLYPDKPNHPRKKMLTIKGWTAFNEMKEKDEFLGGYLLFVKK